MQWPLLLCSAAITALYHFDIAHHDSLAIVIITGIVATGLLRGCNAWQHDLNVHQNRLAAAGHGQRETEKHNAIAGYSSPRRY